MNPMIITPEKADAMGARDISGEIIQSLTSDEISDIIAMGSSIPRVISAINISRTIANVNIKNISLDIIPIPVYGKQEAIHIELSRTKEKIPKIITYFEKIEKENKANMMLWVSRRDSLSNITNLILTKLSKYNQIKVSASGFAIVTAINSVLQVVHSGISKEPICISAIKLDSIKGRNKGEKLVPAIQIFLEKGKRTEYSDRHKIIIEKLLKEG